MSAPPLVELPAGVQAVLFDLDATLLDTESVLDDASREALLALLAAAGVAAPAPAAIDAAFVLSRGGPDRGPGSWPSVVLDALGLRGVVGEEALLLAANAIFDAALPHARFMPGALDALAALPADVPSAIVTSCTREQVALKRALFPAVFARAAVIVTVTDVEPLAKPHPLPYALAAAALGADVAACVVVEDSVPGTRSGAAAGAFVLAVPAPYHVDAAKEIVRGAGRGAVVASLRDVAWAAVKGAPVTGARALPASLPPSTADFLAAHPKAAAAGAAAAARDAGGAAAVPVLV